MLCTRFPRYFNRSSRLFCTASISAGAKSTIGVDNAQQGKQKTSKRQAPDVGHRIKAVGGKSSFIFDLLSFQKYYELYGNTKVPQKFSFQHGESGTGHAGGYIGAQVNNLRAYAKIDPKCVPTELRQTLDSMGFVWDVPKHRLELALKGVFTYKSIYGHEVIPQKFVVPQDDPRWERELWGTKLGMTFLNIKRQYRSTDNRKSVFETAGIVVQRNRSIKAERLVEALQLYKSMYVLPSSEIKKIVSDNGINKEANSENQSTSSNLTTAPHSDTSDTLITNVQFTVPPTFKFPKDHPEVPEHLREYQLGRRVYLLRRGDYKQVREAILSTGLIITS